MATVERSKPIPKEDAQKWGITPEEEFEVDQEALDRTVALMPQKMGLTQKELVEQEINANLGKEGPPDKPGITYDELVAKVEPFKWPEINDMPTLYWLFTSLMVNSGASRALEAEPELLEEAIKFSFLFQTQLSKVIEERKLTLNQWAYMPYVFSSEGDRPRLLRLPIENPEALTSTHLDELAFIPSNPVVDMGLKGIWNAGPAWQRKGTWRYLEDHQTAHITHRPKKGGNIRLEVAPDAKGPLAAQTFTTLDRYLSSLSAFTSDIALLVLASLGGAKNPMVEPVMISATHIRQAKGLELYGKQREEFDARVAEEMENLKRLNFSVTAFNAQDPEDKKWKAVTWKDDRLFDIVTIEEHQGGLYGEGKTVPIAWTVRAGQWAYYFLNPQARQWVAGVAGKLFALSHRDDRRAEQIAKKIGQFVTLRGWKLGKNQPLKWKLKTLLESIGENVEVESKPARLIEALDTAFTILVEGGIFYEAWFQPHTGKKTRGWIQRYLDTEVEFVMTDNQPEIKPKRQLKEHKSKQKAELPTDLGDLIRQNREDRDLNQATVARVVGVSRQYLSDIESGKRTPSHKVIKAINEWIQTG